MALLRLWIALRFTMHRSKNNASIKNATVPPTTLPTTADFGMVERSVLLTPAGGIDCGLDVCDTVLEAVFVFVGEVFTMAAVELPDTLDVRWLLTIRGEFEEDISAAESVGVWTSDCESTREDVEVIVLLMSPGPDTVPPPPSPVVGGDEDST